MYKTDRYYRKLAFSFFKVQRSVYHGESMVRYRLYTAWGNRGTVGLGAHISLTPAALVELFSP